MSSRILFTVFLLVSQLAACSDKVADEVPAHSRTNDYGTLESTAAQGDASDKFALFVHVYEGLPETYSHVDVAVRYLEEAAMGGHSNAQFNLGYLLVNGELVERDEETGVLWLQKAAEGGVRRANLWLGIAYFERYNRQKDSSPSLASDSFGRLEYWLRPVIGRENDYLSLAAQETLGRAYLRQSVFNEDGWSHLFDAATKGFAPAENSLRQMRVILQAELDGGFEEVEPLISRIDEFLKSRSSVE